MTEARSGSTSSPVHALPNFPLMASGPITHRFLSAGIRRFREAAQFVANLPYGRNRDRADFLLVLSEGRGTCSTKHALLAQLAVEQCHPEVELMLGVFLLDEDTAPSLAKLLRDRGVQPFPEAHCYLKHGNERVDLSHPSGDPLIRLGRALHEEMIHPWQIGDYKVELHRRAFFEWHASLDRDGEPGRGTEELWTLRERLISELGSG